MNLNKMLNEIQQNVDFRTCKSQCRGGERLLGWGNYYSPIMLCSLNPNIKGKDLERKLSITDCYKECVDSGNRHNRYSNYYRMILQKALNVTNIDNPGYYSFITEFVHCSTKNAADINKKMYETCGKIFRSILNNGKFKLIIVMGRPASRTVYKMFFKKALNYNWLDMPENEDFRTLPYLVSLPHPIAMKYGTINKRTTKMKCKIEHVIPANEIKKIRYDTFISADKFRFLYEKQSG